LYAIEHTRKLYAPSNSQQLVPIRTNFLIFFELAVEDSSVERLRFNQIVP